MRAVTCNCPPLSACVSCPFLKAVLEVGRAGGRQLSGERPE